MCICRLTFLQQMHQRRSKILKINCKKMGYKQGHCCSERWTQQTGIVFKAALFKDWAGARHYLQLQWHRIIVQKEAINGFLKCSLVFGKETWQKLLSGCVSHSVSYKLLCLPPGREISSTPLPTSAAASLQSQQSRATVWSALLWSPLRTWKRFLYQMGKYKETDGGEIPGNSGLTRMV